MSPSIHPLAALIPEMTPDQFAELRIDVERHGLMEAITLHDGMVLDGRHRLRACEETGVEPRFENFNGPSPVEFVISKNLKRRHLTTSQLAAIAVDFLPAMEEEARKRQGASFRDGTRDAAGHTVSVSPDTDTVPRQAGMPARSAEEAGALVGVSGVSVARAKRVHEQEPEMFEQVKAGTLSVFAADREIREGPQKYRDGSRQRQAEEVVQNIIEKVRGTVAALEHVDTATAVSTSNQLAEWDKNLTEIIQSLHRLRGEIRKVPT